MSKKFLNITIIVLFVFFVCFAVFDFAYNNYIITKSDQQSETIPN